MKNKQKALLVATPASLLAAAVLTLVGCGNSEERKALQTYEKNHPEINAPVTSSMGGGADMATLHRLSGNQTPTEAKEEQQKAIAATGLLNLIQAQRNPQSFQLDDELAMPSGAVCYTYRSQNGFGGMNQGFATLTPKGKLYVDGNPDTGTAAAYAAYQKYCTGKVGQDLRQ
jgi:hypothetical protein